MDAGNSGNPHPARRFPGYTTKELKERLISVENDDIRDQMLTEIERRESGIAPIFVVPQVV